MNSDPMFTAVPKLAAIVFVIPLALLLLWFTWKQVAKSRVIEANWSRTEATVSGEDTETKKTVTLKLLWKGEPVQCEVQRDQGFSSVSTGEQFPVYVNPANGKEVSRTTFDALWGGPTTTGIFGVVLAAVGIFMLTIKPPAPLEGMMDDWEAMKAAAQAGLQPGQAGSVSLQRSAESVRAPRPVDDGRAIVMREPSESWKANVFWGLLFGLLLAVPPFFADKDVATWKKVGSIAAGVAWMAFMGQSAIRNRGRVIRCESEWIEVREPFGSRRIPLCEVRKITRRDVSQKLREFDDIGRPGYKTRGLDTMPTIIVYLVYNAEGKELLKLDKDMQPHGELRRFLDRMEKRTQTAIVDE